MDPERRPGFDQIMHCFETLDFVIVPGANGLTVARLVSLVAPVRCGLSGHKQYRSPQIINPFEFYVLWIFPTNTAADALPNAGGSLIVEMSCKIATAEPLDLLSVILHLVEPSMGMPTVIFPRIESSSV
jgi:hypothetical protein